MLVESRRLIQDTPDAQTQVIDVLFRNMHTIKGNARTYGLLSLTNRVHVVEQSYADLRSKVHSPWDAGLRLQEMDGVQALIEQLRNALDHGIESAVERRALDKPARGHIRLELALNATQLHVVLSDDGRGLAIARIRARAADQGLADPAELSASAAAQLIFESGFTTAERVTEISGRGVGMDVARGFLMREGGSIDVRFLDDDEHAEYRVQRDASTSPPAILTAWQRAVGLHRWLAYFPGTWS